MRNSLTILSNPSRARSSSPEPSSTPQQSKPIPTIRLISATPSATGQSEPNTSTYSADTIPNTSWASIVPSHASPIAPKPAPRKRLVPKKSKLGLLGGTKEKGKDLSDVVRRVGGAASTGRGGFEIYVDPEVDPGMGEIVVVKKKKSRVGLDGLRWGALGEVTNVPSAGKKKEAPKPEEKDKWWTIGRGRKDSKEKTKEMESIRAKSPEPSQDTRARFNSLDSGILLTGTVNQAPHTQRSISAGNVLNVMFEEPVPPRSATPTAGGLLAPPGAVPASANNSIALRAMRSVRSIARIGSWAQLRTPTEESAAAPPKTKAEGGEEKEKKKKKKIKEKTQTVRNSGSSFEVGALSASPGSVGPSLGKRKQSILGLGLPSSMRLPVIRSGSTTSSLGGAPQSATHNRLSALVSGAQTVAVRDRAASTESTASSLRPQSVASGVSTGSSGVSVRWDEERLETVKQTRKKEREHKRQKEMEADKEGLGTDRGKKSKKGAKKNKESRKASDSRKRTPLASVFSQEPPQEPLQEALVVTIEEATVDGHHVPHEGTSVSLETPVKRARPRPVSEQLLGKMRPKGMYEDDDDVVPGGVISMLDAATNDLAQLINRLDLEATPGTPDRTPLRPSPLSALDESPAKDRLFEAESPVKKSGLRANISSISSLRPYSQSRAKATSSTIVGQPIAPWPTLNKLISPEKPKEPVAKLTPKPTHTLRLTNKRTLSPAPAADSSPVFRPLRPAKARNPVSTVKAVPVPSPSLNASFLEASDGTTRSPSSQTFGSRTESPYLQNSPSPVFKKQGHVRKRSSLVPMELHNSHGSIRRDSLPITTETRRVLGLAGTMGGSVASGYTPTELDPSDPDSDIPDELQVILASSADEGPADDTLSYREEAPDSPGSPPEVPLPELEPATVPVFRAQLIDDEDNHADIDEGINSSSEDDTKKSFDFTGEIQKLNESGASDRLSFVEQLENAFRTPARVDLRYDFGVPLKDDLLGVPPLPDMPSLAADSERSTSGSSIPDVQSSITRIIDVSLPTRIECPDSFEDLSLLPRDVSEWDTSIGSRPSDGQLNVDFKFGGRPPAPEPGQRREDPPLTLSDIIPPPSHARSLSDSVVEEDSSVLKSIFAKASELPSPSPRARLNSDTSAKRQIRGLPTRNSLYRHSRQSSEMSFAGFESFAEVRRGFEFNDYRPAFYPPPGANVSRGKHTKQESVFSIASVSSYGMVLHPGSSDPFDYGETGLPERPVSDDMSFAMSMSVDDTFSFIHHNRRRNRVDSDASSFYFRAPSQIQPYARGHRRHESAVSVTSMAPPVSLYNRSFAGHRRSDSGTSASSVAQSYAMYGAGGGRAAWARHRPDPSVDSIMSDFSAMRLGRPGLGDKMLDSGLERGMPLTSISASPPESVASGRLGNRSSFDSIMDAEPRTSVEDSLFEKTGHQTSVSSGSVFGDDDMHPYQRGLLPSHQFRPLSMYSMVSIHSPQKEDDTMITMFDGDHIRRRSVGSMYEASPCVRVEKRKHSAAQGNLPGRRLVFDAAPAEPPKKARIIEKPSIVSTTSSKFGGERMIRARKGLLERQSLEENCLIADGEDFSFHLRPQPVFSRPASAARSRSSTCTSSSGADTPPLSISDGSSQSEGSQSSIDLSRINLILSNTTYPMGANARSRVRARARGQGHRRRISTHMSRASVYETIEEELSVSPSPIKPASAQRQSPTIREPVYIVDPEIVNDALWDDETGYAALRKYYALRAEAQDTVTQSRVVWPDTQFSIFALQSFKPPSHPASMQALLEHSLQNYGPLPSDLRPRRIRSRTQSRASPYPQHRSSKISLSPDHSRPFPAETSRSFAPLQQVPINSNVLPPPPVVDAVKPISPFVLDVNEQKKHNESKHNNSFGSALAARPRVGSTARRTALGWTKRSTGKNENKENVGQGMMMTPGESLRINRPRPRGRPTPASQRPIRV